MPPHFRKRYKSQNPDHQIGTTKSEWTTASSKTAPGETTGKQEQKSTTAPCSRAPATLLRTLRTLPVAAARKKSPSAYVVQRPRPWREQSRPEKVPGGAPLKQ